MTLLRRGQDSKHYHVMPAKTLVYKAMVAMPAMLLVTLGAKARIEFDPYEFVAPTPKQNASILAYQDVVRETASITKSGLMTPSKVDVRRVAAKWIQGADQGTLVSLPPVSYDDSMRDGVKSEIGLRNQAIASQLLFFANEESDEKDYASASSDAMLGIRVSRVLKYSDFPSLMQGSVYERRGLRILIDVLPKVSPDQRHSLLGQLDKVSPRPDKFKQVAELDRFLFIDYLRRMAVDSTKIEAVRPFSKPTAMLPTSQFRGALLVSARDDTIPDSQQLVRLAGDSEADEMRIFNHAVTEAKSTSPAQ